MMDSVENRKKYEMDFTLPFNDRADVNGKRLLGIYKDEKQSHGRHGSMMKVVWNFCKTRVIVASIFYTLSVFSSICAPVIFLKMTLDAIESETSLNDTISSNNSTRTIPENSINLFKVFQFSFNFYGRFQCVYYMLGFVGCLFAAKIFESITTWLNLRTSLRLRTAVLSATYRKALKSSIINNIAPHQILTDDIDEMMELVDYLTKILGTVTALILSLAASIFLLRGPGVWPIFACIGFFCIPIILARVSTNRYRRNQHYLLKKIEIIETFCINFKDIIIHSLSYEYIKNFYCKLLKFFKYVISITHNP